METLNTDPIGSLDPPLVADGAAELATGDDSQPLLPPLTPPTADEPPVTAPNVSEEPEQPVKRKRGRPPKNKGSVGAVAAPRPAPVVAKGKDEEVVCFVCFDGGDLVVCDRRGCPKVYHPLCVNRDENFFQSRGRWNCGWHICSICGRAAKYMCYTCTYSLCKICVRDAKFSCIRGNKGFCETCYKTVSLIESNVDTKEEKAEVDFDDKNSWPYLFKLYWLSIKEKLALTYEELINARSPWKGSGASKRDDDSSDDLYVANDEQEASSDSSLGHHENNYASKRKPRKRSKKLANSDGSDKTVDKPVAGRTLSNDTISVPMSLPEGTQWASPALLEFVSHMKNGNVSALAQFDVQELLLEYIKKNNLRDPRRKSQIICDKMLLNLFGKERVGHFEMLKLIESHFLIKEDSQNDSNKAGISDTVSVQMDAEEYSDQLTGMGWDKKRKSRKKDEEREVQSNVDDFAAIDLHNINLIYLRRNIMEDLLDDMNVLSEKVVGSFVRIRIPGASQKQDMYRLVQVVGLSTVAEKYKVGKKTIDVALEVLNLDKTEVLPIDTISNQDFTEEECRRLRQSIKCGLIKRLTVGDIQEKAKVLQAVRVNDWLESEKLRLSHLRDRASETGRRKELRLCVEKLQILSTPEERTRRLNEIPEVHVDPCMNPNYESPDEEESNQKKRDEYPKSRGSFPRRNAKELVAPGNKVLETSQNPSGTQQVSSSLLANRDSPPGSSKDKSNTFGDRTNELVRDHGTNLSTVHSWEAPRVQSSKSNPNTNTAFEAVFSSGEVQISSSTNEDSKVWHYKDPSEKIQGPFSMAQLRKWSTTGYFPPDLKIWQSFQKPEESVLLTDALMTVQKQEFHHGNIMQPGNLASVVTENNLMEHQRGNNLISGEVSENGSHRNSVQSSASLYSSLEDASRLATHAPNYTGLRGDISKPQEGVIAVSLGSWETTNDRNVVYTQGFRHPNANSFSVPYPGYHSQTLQGSVSQGQSGKNFNTNLDQSTSLMSNESKTFRAANLATDMKTCNSNFSSGPKGQWSDAFNPPSPTPELSSKDMVAFHKPPAAPISTVTIDIIKSAETSTRGLPSLIYRNDSDAGKVTGAHKISDGRSSYPSPTPCEPKELSLDHTNKSESAKVEAYKTYGVESCPTGYISSSVQRKERMMSSAISLEAAVVHVDQNDSSSLGIQEKKQISLTAKDDKVPTAYPAPKFDEVKFVSALKSETFSGPIPEPDLPELHNLAPKHNLEVSKSYPASPGDAVKLNYIRTPEPSLLPTRHSKLDNEMETSFESSLPSPTPVSKSSNWDIVAGPTSVNNQNGHMVSDVTLKSQISNPIGFTSSGGRGPAVTNEDRGNRIQGSTNLVPSRSSQVGLEMTWKTPAQLNMHTTHHHKMPENANTTSATVSGMQGKSGVSVGWGAPLERNANSDWEAMSPTRSNTKDREALSPVHSNVVAGWEAMSPVHPNANACWDARPPAHSNVGWGTLSQGNTNLNSAWRPTSLERPQNSESLGWNTDHSWDTSRWGMASGSNASRGVPRGDFSSHHPRQNDDRNREHGVSLHDGGRSSRYGSISGDHGGFSRHSDRGQAKVQRAVCKYYEKGRCFRGASCNYRHPGYQE